MKFRLYPLSLAMLCIALLLFFSCTSNIDLPPPPDSNGSFDVGSSSSSSLPDGLVLCLFGGNCSAMASEFCSEIGGQPVGSCPAASSSSENSSSSSNLTGAYSSGLEGASSSGLAGASSSSSVALATPSSSSLPEGLVLCQIGSQCKPYDSSMCDMVGTIVPSCSLTCDMPSPIPTVTKNSAMTPQPTVKCNGNVISSGITWTPSNLIFTSVGSQTLSAKVENCNNATASCGTVDVQAPLIRNIKIDMRDSYGDGWNGNALRINVNGIDRTPNTTLSSGSSSSTTIEFNVDDLVKIYWVTTENYPKECAFAIYYTDDPPSPAWDPNASSISDTRILLYRQYQSLTSTANGTLLGSFTVVP